MSSAIKRVCLHHRKNPIWINALIARWKRGNWLVELKDYDAFDAYIELDTNDIILESKVFQSELSQYEKDLLKANFIKLLEKRCQTS